MLVPTTAYAQLHGTPTPGLTNGKASLNGNAKDPETDMKQFLDKFLENPSYPTRSLNFLKTVRDTRADVSLTDGFKLNIIVVGAGLGGLSTSIALARRGHRVKVLEQAAELGEVGAGIQIPSNSARILLDWGLGPLFEGKVVEPSAITFRRWKTGEPIGCTRLIPHFRNRYRAPYYVIHRAHFHDALHKHALELGVKVLVGRKVCAYDEAEPSVTLADGTKFHGDLIVAADGIKSRARAYIPGEEDHQPLHNGFAAYRATVNASKILSDPETAWLLEKPALNLWIGEDRHVMTYTIASGKSFNMVLSHVDRSDPSTWKPEDALKDMNSYFEGWDPHLTKVIKMVEKTLKWPLMSATTLRQWLSPSKKLIVIGDAAHAMVPYMSQGAAMAVEDGAALAEALSHAKLASDLPHVLSVFERVRSERSGQMQQASFINGKLWHFPDGPEQDARDRAMQPEVTDKPFDESPNQWSDPVTQQWTYGYDAVDAIKRELTATEHLWKSE